MVKVLITTDFFSDYELYETSDADDLKRFAIETAKAWNGECEYPELDESKHHLIGSMDDISTEEATAQADMIIYPLDLIEENA